jgi:hypothetical protein
MKRRCAALNIVEKFKVSEKIQAGVSVAKIMKEFGIAKRTVSNIKYSTAVLH